MKIQKARISSNVRFFKNKFYSKYNLTNIDNNYDPVIMFGMYNTDDYKFYLNHKGPIMVAWCGSDAMKLNPKIVNSREAIHVVSSSFVMKDLEQHNILHKRVPFTPAVCNISPKPRGSFIYFYGNRPIYKPELIPEIENRTNLKIIHTVHNTYTPEELLKVYEQCFIGLRLTDHDGIPTTVVELGLMGRRSVHNGDVPHSLKYNTIDDICEMILLEYNNRHSNDYLQISKDWNEFINTGNDWLEI